MPRVIPDPKKIPYRNYGLLAGISGIVAEVRLNQTEDEPMVQFLDVGGAVLLELTVHGTYALLENQWSKMDCANAENQMCIICDLRELLAGLI